VKALAALTWALLAVAVGALAWHSAVFDAYSHDFGTMSPQQFSDLNARMALLSHVARLAVFALVPVDLALVAVAAQRRAFAVMGVALVLAVLLGLFLLLAVAAPGGGLIG
jgi:hypothetical protein